jgi:hypothetical protein
VSVFRDLGERVDLPRDRMRPRAVSSAAEKQEPRVTPSPSRRRASSLGAVLVTVALSVSACGGDDAEASDKPTRPAATSATPTPDPTQSAAPTPASPFEDRAEVRALRGWADAVTLDVNARERDFPSAQRFEVDTDKVRADVEATFQHEFDKYYPGPVPFTPISVKGKGRRSTVTACTVGAGFALKRPGGPPAEKREVIPIVFTMAKQKGSWLLAGILLGKADCGGVRIEEVQR